MSEEPCCICGEWGRHKAQLDASRLKPDVCRRYVAGGLAVRFLCWRCVARCEQCKATIVEAQKRSCEGMCVQCFTESKTRKRRKH